MMTAYSVADLLIFPIYAIIFYFLIKRQNARLNVGEHQKRLLNRSVLIRFAFVIAFFAIIQFYYGYGDSFLYYFSVLDLQKIPWEIKKEFVTSPFYTPGHNDALFHSFAGYGGYFAANISNALVVKVGYYISYLCGNSYITICLFFSMFAFLGCRKFYLLFTSFYPQLYKEFAIAVLFLPSICFWSSGFLKDSLTLGSVGFLIYYSHQLLIVRKGIISSLIWIVISVGLLLLIKAYILLALLPGLVIWLFARRAALIKDKNLRRNMRVVMLFMGIGAAVLLLNYLLSTQFAAQLATEKLDERIVQSQQAYVKAEKGGSYYEIDQQNILLSFPMGIVSTLFRPFIWEVRNFMMAISSLESTLFLMLTLLIWFRIGVFKFFSLIIKNPDTLFFFIFSMLFAGAVGASTPNFGTLGRYKIPCLPFYLMLLFIVMAQVKYQYPAWLNSIIGRRYKVRTLSAAQL